MARESADDDGEVSVRIEAVPEAALRYELEDGTPVVTHANRTFETTFGSIEPETPLRECLEDDAVALDDDAVSDVCSSLVSSGSVDVTGRTSADRTVRLRSDSRNGTEAADGGLLTLTATPSTSHEPVDVENVATVVSHDLRNPLDVAKAHLRAARERGDEEHFDRVADAHDRMERIIEDVLTLARGDETVAPTETLDLEAVGREAWSTVDTGDAELAFSAELPAVEGDRPRLRRLFENLFRNAVEHGSEDGGVRVQVGPSGEGGFFVADDGVGIPADDHDRVFDPGYSSSDSGAGLGLTIVERIADAHDWRVTIPPEATDGARFEFRPRSDEQ